MSARDACEKNSGLVLAAIRRLLAEAGADADLASAGAVARLPGERALARAVGAGRRAVRRALDVLEAEGRIRRRGAQGADVAPDVTRRARDARQEVMEARLKLEPLLAGLAARRADGTDLRRMRALAARIAASGDGDGRELWGGALHRRIAEAAGNAALLAAFDALDARRAATAPRPAFVDPASACRNRAAHERLIDAIATGDAEAAEAAMRRHLLAMVDAAPAPPPPAEAQGRGALSSGPVGG